MSQAEAVSESLVEAVLAVNLTKNDVLVLKWVGLSPGQAEPICTYVARHIATEANPDPHVLVVPLETELVVMGHQEVVSEQSGELFASGDLTAEMHRPCHNRCDWLDGTSRYCIIPAGHSGPHGDEFMTWTLFESDPEADA